MSLRREASGVKRLYDVHGESILGLVSQNTSVGECIALVSLTLVSAGFSVLPGFAPAGDLLSPKEKDLGCRAETRQH
jgi:hypothetical protein